MRTLLGSLLVLLAVPVFLQAQSKTSREQLGLLGPVHNIRIELEVPAEAGSTAARVLLHINVFDEKGNSIQQTTYNRDGSLAAKFWWKHVYDAQGRVVKTSWYNAKGILTYSYVSVYDEKGLRTETTFINPKGSTTSHVQLFYDEYGRKISEAHRQTTGAADDVRLTYDANGQVTSEMFSQGPGFFRHEVFTYDERGRPTGRTTFKADGTPVQMYKWSHTYDDRGNMKEKISYAPDGSVSSRETFTYEFDERGNWIKRITSRELFKEGRPQNETEVTYRTITYF
jgi:antitoxin component YwqK of YwqJK toxin-antitoxin module